MYVEDVFVWSNILDIAVLRVYMWLCFFYFGGIYRNSFADLILLMLWKVQYGNAGKLCKKIANDSSWSYLNSSRLVSSYCV